MMCEPERLELKQQVFKTYPLIFKRFENISRMSNSSGKLPEFVKKIYVKVIEFCLEYCESIPVITHRDKGVK